MTKPRQGVFVWARKILGNINIGEGTMVAALSVASIVWRSIVADCRRSRYKSDDIDKNTESLLQTLLASIPRKG